MKPVSYITAFAILMGLLTCGTAAYAEGGAIQRMTGTTLERIEKSGTIRCGYFTWPPSYCQRPEYRQIVWYQLRHHECCGSKLRL